MPNYFLKETQEPVYDTADAALLFINCVWQYWQDTGDERFVCQMYPVMERIIQGYCRGTRYAIHMDEDGLIYAGEGEEQVTWMNMQAGEILPTPPAGETGRDQCLLVQCAEMYGGNGGTRRERMEAVMGGWRFKSGGLSQKSSGWRKRIA